MKLFLLTVLLLALASSNFIRQNHDFWYTAPKKAATSSVPFGDLAWNYCDMKCAFLENYYPGNDFVVIQFTKSIFTPNFAACYVKNALSGGYVLWNKVATNSWYEKHCGKESQDYYALSKGESPKYTIQGDILGIGIGTQIRY